MTDKELRTLLAKSAAQFVAEDQGWKAQDVSVVDMSPYYSLTGKLEAYAIELQASGDRRFTVIGGANMKHPPIIQACEGDPPHFYYDKQYFYDREKGRRELTGLEIKNNLYLGAFCYGVEVSDQGKTLYLDLTRHFEIPSTFVDRIKARRQMPVKQKAPEGEEPVDRNEVAFFEEAERMELRQLEWAYLGSHSRWHEGYISHVPRCEWGSSGVIPGGCAPCAATMVLGYWGYRGYGSLPEIDWDSMGSDPDEDTLQNALEAAMDTDNTGDTEGHNIDNGIRDVLDNYGCSDFRVTNWWTTSRTDFIRGVNRVDDGHPFLLNVFDSDTYGNHSMCVIGYRYNDGGARLWHSMRYKCLTTWASRGTDWEYVSYAEGDSQMQTAITR